ncbi:MAG: ABC transporter ATP-binding protein [Burkholderiales bacterium]
MSALLETVGLTRFFGMVRAAEDLNVRVAEGETVGIIGSNGSGKTTFLNLATGYLKPERGRILLAGRDTTGLPPRTITRMGVARSFQVPQLYLGLTVLENLLLSLAARSGNIGLWAPLHQTESRVEARKILAQFGLEPHAERSVRELPEGARKLLDIAIAVALRPRLLLMDEPTAGVSTEDKFEVMDTLVAALRGGEITTIFVEHDMDVVLRYSQRVLVFDQGLVIADGRPDAVLSDAGVRKAVLGHV